MITSQKRAYPMNFKTSCPHCQQNFEASDEHLETWMSCPTCSNDFAVKRPPPVIERMTALERKNIELPPAVLAKIKAQNQKKVVDSSHFEVVAEKKNTFLDFLKGSGAVILWIGAGVLLLTLGMALLGGAVWVGEKSFVWLLKVCGLAMGVCLLILPLLFFRSARVFVGLTYVYASYVFGLTSWVWCLLLAYSYWGWIGLVIGLFSMGVGVFPVALLACSFHGNWSTTLQLLVAGILIFVARGLGGYFVSLGDKE